MMPPIEAIKKDYWNSNAVRQLCDAYLALEAEKMELERLLLPFREAIKRARSHKLGEAWASSYLNNNAWLKLEQALKEQP